MLDKHARLQSHETRSAERSDILTFDPLQYPFDRIVSECVRRRLAAHTDNSQTLLSNLHRFVKPDGLDSIYAAIYDLFLATEFKEPYDRLCRKIIAEKFAGRAAHQRV